MMSIDTLICSNCEQPIGRLEEPQEHGNHIVCPACYRKLRQAAPVPPSPPLTRLPTAAYGSIHMQASQSPPRDLHYWAVGLGLGVCLMLLSFALPASAEARPVLLGLGLLMIAVVGSFLPYAIAGHRRHPNKLAIGLVCLFAGWTGLGWLLALIWSVLAIPAAPTRQQ